MEEEKITEVVEEKQELTLGLLNGVKTLVEAAINRGAYRPEELSKVGEIYDKFMLVLKDLSKKTSE